MIKELLYPFDAEWILENKKKIRRTLMEGSETYLKKNIAILGGSTTAAIRQMMEIFLLNEKILPTFYESEYNKYFEDAVFDNEELSAFKPDIVYICTSNRNITAYPNVKNSAEEIDALLNNEISKYEMIWKSLEERYHCTTIQNNFEMPYFRLMGNRDIWDIHGKGNFISRLNQRFYEYASSHENFYICDIQYLSADYGLKKWSDPFYYDMYKYALNVNAVPYLGHSVASIIKSICGKNKKGFVLDLDNTLWGGIVGDDGVENLKIGSETAKGESYAEFQRYLKEHKDLGIILNIDSKNDYENAIAGLKHPSSELSPDDFIEIRANWEPKDRNFADIAEKLNLLPESLIFVDDNPAERQIVADQLKGVAAVEVTSVEHYIEAIDRNNFFETTIFSKDDLKRNQMYKDNAVRNQEMASYGNYHDYLLSLDMKGIIRNFEPVYLDRITQLTGKTNQFNLTTRRYNRQEIEDISANSEYIDLYGKLIDKYGDNGLISVVIGHVIEDVCDIDLWIMSCRVLKRDMEFAMMDALVKECRKKNVSKIVGHYYPTAKNSMVKDFFGTLGFDKIEEDNSGNSRWLFEIPEEYVDKNTVIKEGSDE